MSQFNTLELLSNDWQQFDSQDALIPITLQHHCVMKDETAVITWRDELLQSEQYEGWLILTDQLHLLTLGQSINPMQAQALPLSAEYYCPTSATSYRLVHQSEKIWQLHSYHYESVSNPNKADYLADCITHKVDDNFMPNQMSAYYRCWGVDQYTQSISMQLAFFIGFENTREK